MSEDDFIYANYENEVSGWQLLIIVVTISFIMLAVIGKLVEDNFQLLRLLIFYVNYDYAVRGGQLPTSAANTILQ